MNTENNLTSAQFNDLAEKIRGLSLKEAEYMAWAAQATVKRIRRERRAQARAFLVQFLTGR